MKNSYEIKDSFSHDFGNKAMIEDVDMKSRTVTGYFSRFGNKDSYGDIMEEGSFKRTIRERGLNGKNIIPHILDHELWSTLKMLSKPVLSERKDGGFFESTISDTQNGIDTLKLYRDGVINQHSFGFKVIKFEEDKNKETRTIKEVMLYEISTVTLGANDQTPFTGFKSLSKKDLLDRYKTVKKAFDNGDYSDEIFPALEAQLKQMEADIIEQYILNPTNEPDTSTQADEKKAVDALNNFLKKLNN